MIMMIIIIIASVKILPCMPRCNAYLVRVVFFYNCKVVTTPLEQYCVLSDGESVETPKFLYIALWGNDVFSFMICQLVVLEPKLNIYSEGNLLIIIQEKTVNECESQASVQQLVFFWWQCQIFLFSLQQMWIASQRSISYHECLILLFSVDNKTHLLLLYLDSSYLLQDRSDKSC